MEHNKLSKNRNGYCDDMSFKIPKNLLSNNNGKKIEQWRSTCNTLKNVKLKLPIYVLKDVQNYFFFFKMLMQCKRVVGQGEIDTLSITSDESFRGVSHGVPVGNQILGIVSRQLLIGSLCTSQPCQCFYLSVCWCAAFHNGASFNCWGGNLVILVSIYRRVVGLIVDQLFKIDTSLTSGLQLVMSGLWGYSI